jgi:rSAM/selenodomain-associated transferase 2
VKISVVIPTFDEASCIAGTVESVVAPGIEVIVVDGGSRDETRRLARNAGARVLACERGRARQLRMGGEKSTGDVVLFLHADTRLESGWQEAVQQVLSDPECAGGAFAFRFAERGPRERWIEWGVALRVALFRLPYGDQALFVRRSVLERMGGIPIVPIMEDLDLVRAIKRAGRLQILERTATTSSRRYVRGGTLRTVFQHQRALLGWWLGWDRTRLAERMGR